MTDFDRWLQHENDKMQIEECYKRNHRCDGCPYEEECQYDDLMNSLEEW